VITFTWKCRVIRILSATARSKVKSHKASPRERRAAASLSLSESVHGPLSSFTPYVEDTRGRKPAPIFGSADVVFFVLIQWRQRLGNFGGGVD